jgi:hypothetical protein
MRKDWSAGAVPGTNPAAPQGLCACGQNADFNASHNMLVATQNLGNPHS